MSGPVDLSALVVNYNTTRHAREMLESLRAQDARAPDGRALRVEFVFVDNASPRLDAAELERIRELAGSRDLPGKVVLHDRNAGYSGGMNLAYEHCSGEHVLVLNPDLVFMPDCVSRLYAYLAENDDAGAVGPAGYWDRGLEVMLPPNILPTLWDLWFCTAAHVFASVNRRYMAARLREALRVYEASGPVVLDMLSGACVMLARDQVDAIGGLFDSGYPLYYEDTDLFRRIRQSGKRLVMVPAAKIAHFYNRSGTTDPGEAMRRYRAAKRYYYTKWYGLAGRVSESVCRGFLGSRLARRARDHMAARAIDLGEVWAPPTLDLGRVCRRYLLELCQDAGFLLAAAIPGSGRSWTPGPSFWAAFGDSEYFLRAVDLSGATPEEVAVFRFRRVPPPAVGDPATTEEPPGVRVES